MVQYQNDKRQKTHKNEVFHIRTLTFPLTVSQVTVLTVFTIVFYLCVQMCDAEKGGVKFISTAKLALIDFEIGLH